jgi:hypothetical protein
MVLKKSAFDTKQANAIQTSCPPQSIALIAPVPAFA